MDQLDITIKDIQTIQSDWSARIIHQDIDGLMKLYAPNAVLKPTLSDVIRRTPDDIKVYFIGGGPLSELGFLNNKITNIQFVESSPLLLGPLALDTGIYHFTKSDGDIIVAHFTICYQKSPTGDVHILLQHSSLQSLVI